MNSDVSFSRAKLILDLTKCKIHRSIIEYVARKARSSVKTGSRLKVYESLNDKALDVLHNAFVRCETDKSGKFLELRLGGRIMNKIKGLKRVDFRKKLIGASRVPHEIDVVGYNKQDEIVVIGECKATKSSVKKDHIMKWLNEIEDITKADFHEKIDFGLFISRNGYTDDAIQTLKKDDRINKEGKLTIKLGRLSKYYINLYLLEEIDKKVEKIFP